MPELLLAELIEEGVPSDLRCLAMRLLRKEYPEGIATFFGRICDKELYKMLLHEPSAQAQREVLLSLRDTDASEAKPIILELAKEYDGKDRFYLEAIGIAVGRDPKRREILLADFAAHFPEWNEKVAGLVWELRPPDMMTVLEKRLADAKVPAAQRAQIVGILAASDDKEAGTSLMKVLRSDAPAEVRNKVLDNLKQFLPGKWQNLRESKELKVTIDALLAKAESRPTALTLIGAAERRADIPRVAELARNAKEAEAVRKAAVQTLGQLPSGESVQALRGLMEDKTAGNDAIAALGRLARNRRERSIAEQALKSLQDAVLAKGAAGHEALSALAGTRSGSQWLLDRHAKKALSADLDADAGRLLRNSPHVDLRNKALIAFPPPRRLDPQKLPTIAHLLARRGDAKRGKQLIAVSSKNDMQCLKCHTIGGSGGQIGPDLSAIGKKASKQDLLESILEPSKAIADQFAAWQIETKAGLSLSGLIVEETPTALTLRDGNGKDTKIDKKDIENRHKSAKSLMPDNLLAYVTEDDLVDIVAYLLELK